MRTPLVVALASTLAAPAAAQVAVADEGSFTITANGERIGREDFRIRATPGPANRPTFIASGTVAYDGRRLSPALSTDTALAPIGYEVEVRDGATSEKLSGTLSRGRISVRIRSPRGESAREYVVTEGAYILDDDVFHQYFFLARREATGAVPVVVPRRNVQVTMRVSWAGAEPVTIGGRSISARKMVLEEPGAGRREVWVDEAGRVLRVSLPAKGIVATRDDPPR